MQCLQSDGNSVSLSSPIENTDTCLRLNHSADGCMCSNSNNKHKLCLTTNLNDETAEIELSIERKGKKRTCSTKWLLNECK